MTYFSIVKAELPLQQGKLCAKFTFATFEERDKFIRALKEAGGEIKGEVFDKFMTADAAMSQLQDYANKKRRA